MPNTIWIDTLLNLQISSGSQGSQTLQSQLSVVEARFAGLTLLRTIIGLNLGHLVHDSGEGSQIIDLGIGITSQEAFAAAILPDPNVSTDFPTRGWIFRGRYRTYGFAADQAAVFQERVDKDIKARRKLENGEAYIVVNNVPDQGTTGTVHVGGLIRQLWLIT